MDVLKGKSALIVGASSGIGRATLLALAGRGVRVCGVARDRARIERLAREAPGDVTAVAEDATRAEVIARLFRDTDPDLVVVSAGVRPKMAPLEEQSWESFSEAWGSDVRIAFLVCQEALRRPLRPGSVVLVVSSGAAIAGSPLSGGYAGAKRMQWLLTGYAQRSSDARKLGVRFVTLVPKQLVVGTANGEVASRAYAEAAGISQAAFMERFGQQLMPEGVADAIVKIAGGEPGTQAGAIAVTGKGLEAL